VSEGGDFEAFYGSELRPALEELEARRRKVWRSFGTAALIVVAVLVPALCLLAPGAAPPLFFIMPIAAALLLALVWFAASRGFKEEFKRRIVGAVARHVHPSLRYDPKAHISREQFRASGIFNRRIDRFSGEDHVAGKIGATAIEFSELHAHYKTTSRSGKTTQTHWHTIFKGLFVIADFNKEFRGMTVVLPDVAERALGWLGQSLQGMFDFARRGELVKLEDAEFERQFVVYAEDQVEARYVLSPSLMERLLAFRRKTGKEVYFAFVRSKAYIAVKTGRNMFEPRWFSSVVDRQMVEEYLRDLRFAVGIVEDLDLNTRIWTKE
jgi:hypothetical protein